MKLSLLIVVLLSACAMADTPTEQLETMVIPLDQIWAWKMPGTRDIRQLQSQRFGQLIRPIRQSLRPISTDQLDPLKRSKPQPAFAVMGIDEDALREAHAVLVEGQEPRQCFPSGSNISIVFFSYRFDRYVHLHKVELNGTVINIRYQFIPHKSTVVTEHFAIIPLSELPVGKYDVQITRSPSDYELIESDLTSVRPEWKSQIICKPFSFSIEGQKTE